MHSTYRLLAPAPPSDGSPEPNGKEPRRRKKKARLACDQCRLKRVGVSNLVLAYYSLAPHCLGITPRADNWGQCDSIRPECARCLKAGTPCVYLSEDAAATPTMALKSKVENLERRLQEHVDFLERIRNAPEDEALSLVRQLRSTQNVSALLLSHQGCFGGTSQLSEHASAVAVMPSIGSGIESEMSMIQPPTAYHFIVSPNPSSVTSASLANGPASLSVATSSGSTSLPSSEPHAYCDPRLEHLSVEFWTRIPIDDRLAAQAISHFVELDHHVLGFFNADLFLRDLIQQGLTFCSSFLFNSVMAIACVC